MTNESGFCEDGPKHHMVVLNHPIMETEGKKDSEYPPTTKMQNGLYEKLFEMDIS